MHSHLSLLVSAITLSLQGVLATTTGVNGDCFNLGFGPQGTCNTDSFSAAYLKTYLIDDHINSSCPSGGNFSAVAAFVDINGITSTVTAYQTTSVSPSFTGTLMFSYNIPISTIAAGPVRVTYKALNQNKVLALAPTVVTYTQVHIPTITLVSTLQTVTATVLVKTTTSSTYLNTKTITTVVTPIGLPTIFRKTSTVITLQSTITTILTFTPSPKHNKFTSLIYTTTTLSCIPPPKQTAVPIIARDVEGRDDDSHLNKRGTYKYFAVPFCASPTTTTLITRTNLITSLVTATDTVVVLGQSQTIIETSIATAIVKYISISKTTTKTLTPRLTRVWTNVPRATIVETFSRTITNKVLASGSRTPLCLYGAEPVAPNPLTTERIIKAGSTQVSTSSTTSTPSGPSSKPTVGNFVYQACHLDSSIRALSQLSTSHNAMTLEDCANTCSSYAYFGVEFGRECYCGNYISLLSIQRPASECNLPCSGDSSELCGAGWRMNLYKSQIHARVEPVVAVAKQSVGSYNFQGCYSDSSSSRALTGRSTSNSAMSLEACATYCAGFSYFGNEYGVECFCGNTLQSSSEIKLVTDCSFVCPGNNAELCGAGNRISLYKK